MEEENDAFYVVRKGDVIGIYKSFSDCQEQAGSSVCNPSMSVYKGYNFPKEAEEYLVSHGLRNATYTISAASVRDDLFGKLHPCPYKQPCPSTGITVDKEFRAKRPQEVVETDPIEIVGSNPQKKHFKSDSGIDAQTFYSGWASVGANAVASNLQTKQNLNNGLETLATSSRCLSCILQFDGASKGNPGKAGAGAVLCTEDGSMVYRLREGVGIATNNVAEYRGVILGLRHALKKGFKHIRVQGDSKLVCMQIQGLWKTKNPNMAELCKEAKELKEKFVSFEINHVLREFNSEADAQANLAINLKDGEVVEDCKKK